ncbi:unannotated protein [freshwater metagenome]|uniref:Unannotated protein n=1 Tax=freshwater metagenome TaxID=449393 RepID=A0A6J6QZT3_9ZZZZ
MLAARRALVDLPDTVELLDLGPDVLGVRRGRLTVVLNCGQSAVPLPPGEVVVASGPLGADLSPDTAAWVLDD